MSNTDSHVLFSDLLSLLYEDRLDRLRLWSLEERRHRADLIEVCWITHGLSPISTDMFLTASHDQRTRGHVFKLSRNHYHEDIFFYICSQNEESSQRTNSQFLQIQTVEIKENSEWGLFMD
jgi:hypothetical protein